MPIMTASNDLPPEPTSRVVISRSLPSSRIVYLTLIPVLAVKSDGVSDAMSVICGFFTIATLIVFAVCFELAVLAHAALMSAAAAPATKTRVSERLPNTNLCIRGSFPASETCTRTRFSAHASRVPRGPRKTLQLSDHLCNTIVQRAPLGPPLHRLALGKPAWERWTAGACVR